MIAVAAVVHALGYGVESCAFAHGAGGLDLVFSCTGTGTGTSTALCAGYT